MKEMKRERERERGERDVKRKRERRKRDKEKRKGDRGERKKEKERGTSKKHFTKISLQRTHFSFLAFSVFKIFNPHTQQPTSQTLHNLGEFL